MIFKTNQDITVVMLILYVSYEPYSKGIFGAIIWAQSNTLGKYTLCQGTDINPILQECFCRVKTHLPVILVNMDSAPLLYACILIKYLQIRKRIISLKMWPFIKLNRF